jgi:hypothetical protein
MSTIVEFLKQNPENFDDDDDNRFSILQKLIENEFPNFPLFISLDDEDLVKLDEPFTNMNTIFICNKPTNSSFEFSDYSENELSELADYLKIDSLNNNPITLRQVLQAINNSDYYQTKFKKHNRHPFLEGFDKDTDIQYSLSLGS